MIARRLNHNFRSYLLYIPSTIAIALKQTDESTGAWKVVSNIYARVRRAAIGIVMCLGPFNYPLNGINEHLSLTTPIQSPIFTDHTIFYHLSLAIQKLSQRKCTSTSFRVTDDSLFGPFLLPHYYLINTSRIVSFQHYWLETLC